MISSNNNEIVNKVDRIEKQYLSPQKVHEELLVNLVTFDKFCRLNDLFYSLAFGTLLGAIRHQGFIPWDDDVDVIMPRQDYEKLIACSTNLPKPFEIQGIHDLSVNESPFLKFVNKKFKAQEASYSDESFLWLDIFPIDGMSEDVVQAEHTMKTSMRYQRLLASLYSNPKHSKSGLKMILKYLVTPFKNKYCRRFVAKKINLLAREIPYGDTEYVGIVTWSSYGIAQRFSYQAYKDAIQVNFEGKQFLCIPNWDELLSNCYGDYMKLPPKEARESHEVKVWHAY